MKYIFLLLLLFSASINIGLAETDDASDKKPVATTTSTMYVSDKLVIMLRAGPSNKHKILTRVNSGAKLEILEPGEKYHRVRTGKGKEGWVLNQYLSDKVPAQVRLNKANQQIAKLKQEIQQLQDQLSQLNNAYKKVKEEHRILDKEKSEMAGELSHIRNVAADPLALSDKNRELATKTMTMEGQVDVLKQELQVLRDDSQKQWFLTGAGVVLLGILIGLMVPKLRRHRRSDWSNLT